MRGSKKTKKELVEELQALQESEEIYRTLVENISLGITLIDTNYRIIMTNAGQGRLLKKSQSEFIGKYCFREFEKRDAVCSHCPGTRAMATGRPAEVKTEGVRDDGSRLPVRIHAFPVYEADGTVKGFIEVVEDITERKQAAEALKESQETYKTLFEGTAEGILVVDIETKRFKYANPATCRMLGYTEEELKRLGVPDIHPKEVLQHVISEFEAQVRGEKSLAVAIPCLRKDGTVIYADINSTNVLIDGVECNVGLFTDITKRKHTEEELLFKTTLLEAQSETSIDGVLVVDGKGKSLLFNKRFGQMWNIPQHILNTRDDEKMIQCVLSQLKDPDRFLEKVRYLYAHEDEKSRDEIQFKDGRVFDRYSSPLLDSNNKHYGRIWYFRDVTDRKRAEERLAEVNECFLSFGADPVENIKSLTALCGKQLGGRCAIYNRLEDGQLCSVGQWNTPADYKPIDKSEGHICSDLISKATDEILLVRHLPETTYARTDPNVAAYGLKTYIGKATKCCGKYVGSICVVYQKDFVPGEDDKRILGIVASAIGVEEERRLAEKALKASRDELEIRVRERTADLEKAVKKLRNEVSERKKAEEKLLTYQKQLRSSASELSLAEERLRRKIATDVHDHISQNLAISKLKIESLTQSATSPELARELEEIRDLIAQVVESTRSLTFELSPPVLYELGFEAAVEWLVRQTRKQYGLSAEFEDDGRTKPLDGNVRILLFQAVRELLVNVVKHAKASSVKVSTQRVGDQIRVSVEDDGVGFDVAQVHSQDHMTSGFGLFNIRERLDHIGGHLDIASRAGKGTRITLVAPITHEKEKNKGKQK